MKNKYLYLICSIGLISSGVANAVTPVANGSLAMEGKISTATCAVSPDKNNVTFTLVGADRLAGISDATRIETVPVSFDFTDCGSLPNGIDISLTPSAPNGTSNWGVFTYSTSEPSAGGPLMYSITRGFGTVTTPIPPSSKTTLDITGVDKNNFKLPLNFNLTKRGANPVTNYIGTYSVNLAWNIEYP